MAGSLKHGFQSGVADSPDTSLIQPSHWNAEHSFKGGSNNAVLVRSTGASNGFDWTLTPSLTDLTLTGLLKAADGTFGAPSVTWASNPNTGLFSRATNTVAVSAAGAQVAEFNTLGLKLSGTSISWSSANFGAANDLVLAQDAANVLAIKTGANAQALRTYGYSSGARAAYGAVQTALGSVTLSGASSATGNIIPAGSFVLGVATTTTTTITGATGYTAGDGSDVDRYGDITGTAVGTHSDNTNATANPTGYNAAASAVTLTAKTSNFTGGVVQVVVFYMTTGSA